MPLERRGKEFILTVRGHVDFTKAFCKKHIPADMYVDAVKQHTTAGGAKKVYTHHGERLFQSAWTSALKKYNDEAPEGHKLVLEHIQCSKGQGKRLTTSPVYKQIMQKDDTYIEWSTSDDLPEPMDANVQQPEVVAVYVNVQPEVQQQQPDELYHREALNRAEQAALKAGQDVLQAEQSVLLAEQVVLEAQMDVLAATRALQVANADLTAKKIHASAKKQEVSQLREAYHEPKRARLSSAGVYVLKNTVDDTYYVGKSDNVEARISEHLAGTGAACTLISGPTSISVAPLTKGSAEDLESWERDETLERMHKHGLDKVRGWIYSTSWAKLSDETRRQAWEQICARKELCYKCGDKSHFAAQCGASRGTKPDCYYG